MGSKKALILLLPLLSLWMIYLFQRQSEPPLSKQKKETDGLSFIETESRDHNTLLTNHLANSKNKDSVELNTFQDENPVLGKSSSYKVKELISEEWEPVTEVVTGKKLHLRKQLVKTDMKYPYILIEETFEKYEIDEKVVAKKVEMIADHMMVQKKETMPSHEFEKLLSDAGWEIRKQVNKTGLYLIKTKGELSINSLKGSINSISSEVILDLVEPDYVYHPVAMPNDSRFFKSWSLHNTGRDGTAGADIDAVRAWDISTGSRDIKVAILDGGVDHQHEDLKDNMWVNPGEIPGNKIDDDKNGYVDDIYGYDWKNGDGNPMGSHSHGTHCAGIVGMTGNNGKTSTGVNWKVSLVALRIDFVSSDIIAAMDYATAIGCTATSNSYGGGGNSTSVRNAIKRAYKAGVMMVAAAGNFGQNSDKNPVYPANHNVANVVSVGASDWYDRPASWSNYGKEKVHVFAPGDLIYSTKVGGGTVSWSGTSMAAPHVAGLFALFESAHPGLSVEKRRHHLMRSVDKIDSMSDKCVSGGRINAYKMLMNDTDAPSPNPMTFSKAPKALGHDSITMTATQANDTFPVQYYFQNLSFPDGSHDSGWIDSRTYIDEDLDTETSYSYRVRVRDLALKFNLGKWSNTMSATTTKPQMVLGESGSIYIDQTSADDWALVELSNEYENPVIYVSCQSYNGTQEFNVRVKNVGKRTFRVQVDEWDYHDGVHVKELVSYLVVEEGRHVLKDGRVLQAGVSKGHVDGDINFPLAFREKPMVFTQVVTVNESKAVTTRVENVTASGFSVLLQGQESTPEHQPERVHWMAWEQGSGDLDGLAQSGLIAENINNSWSTLTWQESLPSIPNVFIAMQTMNEVDPAVIRLRNIDKKSFEARLQEETSLDSEGQHSNETVATLGLEKGEFRKFLLENEPPEAYHTVLIVYPGTTGEVELIAADAEGDELTFQLSSSALYGEAHLESNRFIYTPDDYELREEDITFTVSDGFSSSREARVKVSIVEHPFNQRPVSSDEMVSTYRNRSVDFSVIAEDGDGDALSFVQKTAPSHGQIEGSFPNFTYHPNPFYIGSDVMEFYVDDGKQRSVLHRVSLTCSEVDVETTIGEAGFVTVEQFNREQDHHINLARDYQSPIVLMSVASSLDPDPVTVKLLSSSDNTFAYQLCEWEYQDGVHGEELISYVVFEEGIHKINEDVVVQAGSGTFKNKESIAFLEPFHALPIVTAQAMGNIAAKAVAIRMQTIESDRVKLRFQGQESDRFYSELNLNWLAISEGSGVSGDQSYEFVNTGRSLDHNWLLHHFTQAYHAKPIPLTSLLSNYGTNTSVTRMKNAQSGQVEIKLEEEQSLDDEIVHTKEELGIFVLEDGPIFGSSN